METWDETLARETIHEVLDDFNKRLAADHRPTLSPDDYAAITRQATPSVIEAWKKSSAAGLGRGNPFFVGVADLFTDLVRTYYEAKH